MYGHVHHERKFRIRFQLWTLKLLFQASLLPRGLRVSSFSISWSANSTRCLMGQVSSSRHQNNLAKKGVLAQLHSQLIYRTCQTVNIWEMLLPNMLKKWMYSLKLQLKRTRHFLLLLFIAHMTSGAIHPNSISLEKSELFPNVTWSQNYFLLKTCSTWRIVLNLCILCFIKCTWLLLFIMIRLVLKLSCIFMFWT